MKQFRPHNKKYKWYNTIFPTDAQIKARTSVESHGPKAKQL